MTSRAAPGLAPAPAGLPIIDDDPYSDANLRDPYPLFERLRDAGPVVWLSAYNVRAVARFAELRAILTDHTGFINSAGVGPRNHRHEGSWRDPGILDADQPQHTPMRAAMADVMTPRVLRPLRAQFEQVARDVVERALQLDVVDGVTDLAEAFTLKAFGDAVGIPDEGRHENLLAHGAMNFSQFGPENDRYRQFMAAGEHTVPWVMANCARERLSPDGLGMRLWQAADAGLISAHQATLLVRALLSAGLDTTILGLGNTLQCLAGAPHQQQLVAQNPRLVKFAVDEALRLESPFTSFFRTTSGEVSVAGHPIADDTKVALFPGSANRDPRQWGDDADRYLVQRAASGHLAFGMGIHQCVGQPISRLEQEVLVNELFRRVSSIEPAGEPEPFVHNTLRGWTRLPLRLTAR